MQLKISPLATVQLQASAQQLVCGEPSVALTAVASSSGRYSWADDSTTQAHRVVSQPGTYRVRFLSIAGCLATDSITIRPVETEHCLIPNIITPNGGRLNQHFVLAGYALGHWSIIIYNRWGRTLYANPRYANEWDAEGLSAGMYYYLLQHSQTGAELRGLVEVVR